MGKSLLISANAAYVFNNIGKVTFNDPSLIYNGLTITAQEDLTLRFSNDLEYRNNVSILWKPLKANTPLSIENGETVTLKGKLIPTTNGIGTFIVSGNFTVSGNILSLINDGTMQNYSFKNLFKNCTTLIDASNITLPDYVTQNCYEGMFYGCTSIEESPILSAQTLQNNCYTDMFYGCSSLREIICKNISDISQYVNSNWVYGVASTGVFEIDNEGYWNDTNKASHIPENWEITTGVLTNKYLTFRILTPGTISWLTTNESYVKTISYSKDGGETWTDITSSIEGTEINVVTGDKVLFKGNNAAYSTNSYYSRFNGTAKFNVEGNIMSLIDGDDFVESTSFNNNTYVFFTLFENSNIVSAQKLVLPVLSLTKGCYKSMFKNNSYFVEAPELPATTLAEECYQNMFYSCTALTSTPTLSATTLAKNCYNDMFNGCTSLTTIPDVLPATTLAVRCYCGMFVGCTSLTTVSNTLLPATTVKESSYEGMFNRCTSLTKTPQFTISTINGNACCRDMFYGCTSLTNVLCTLSATSLSGSCYNQMFYGCTSLTTAPSLPATTLVSSCYYQMFRGCTSLTTTPALPATTLATQCYCGMFYNCTSLTTTPTLSATTLVEQCYKLMFYGCTSLTTTTSLSATTLATNCYQQMFYGCTALTVAPALPATTLANNCYHEMFRGCTSLITAPDLLATMAYHGCYSGMFRGCSRLNYVKCMYNEVDGGATLWRDDMLTGVAATGTLVKEINTDWSGYAPSGWTVNSEGVLKPTISFDGKDITLDCQTSGATIYYQLNNTGNYVAYTGIISISADTIIKTYAELNGVTSPIVSSLCTYVPTSIVDPTFSFELGTTIIISCITPNCTIYYRLNNTGNFVQYTEPITINATTFIEAYSELDGSTSNTVSETFTYINYMEQYFTIESLADSNTISLSKGGNNISLSYSTDDGTTWTDLSITSNTTFATINTGDKILFKGTNNYLATAWDKYNRFNGSKNFNVYGNVMSLLYGDNFINYSEFPSGTTTNLCGLFYGTTTVIDASNLYMSALTCTVDCYNGTFRGCTNLIAAPKLLATTPAKGCCSSMFEGCINLETVPEINFTTMAQEACQRMFCMNRNSRITTPKMTKSPVLRCTTHATNCYKEMFKGNGNLIEVTCLLTSPGDTDNWLANCSTSGTFKKASGASWTTGASGIPSGWTVVDYTE